MLQVTPIPGTDYQSLDVLLGDWNSGKEFYVMNRNQMITLNQAKTNGVPGGKLQFFYNGYTETYIMDLGPEYDNELVHSAKLPK